MFEGAGMQAVESLSGAGVLNAEILSTDVRDVNVW